MEDSKALNEEDSQLPPDAPDYLKKLNARFANDKVGQTFVTFVKKRPPKDQNSDMESEKDCAPGKQPGNQNDGK